MSDQIIQQNMVMLNSSKLLLLLTLLTFLFIIGGFLDVLEVNRGVIIFIYLSGLILTILLLSEKLLKPINCTIRINKYDLDKVNLLYIIFFITVSLIYILFVWQIILKFPRADSVVLTTIAISLKASQLNDRLFAGEIGWVLLIRGISVITGKINNFLFIWVPFLQLVPYFLLVRCVFREFRTSLLSAITMYMYSNISWLLVREKILESFISKDFFNALKYVSAYLFNSRGNQLHNNLIQPVPEQFARFLYFMILYIVISSKGKLQKWDIFIFWLSMFLCFLIHPIVATICAISLTVYFFSKGFTIKKTYMIISIPTLLYALIIFLVSGILIKRITFAVQICLDALGLMIVPIFFSLLTKLMKFIRANSVIKVKISSFYVKIGLLTYWSILIIIVYLFYNFNSWDYAMFVGLPWFSYFILLGILPMLVLKGFAENLFDTRNKNWFALQALLFLILSELVGMVSENIYYVGTYSSRILTYSIVFMIPLAMHVLSCILNYRNSFVKYILVFSISFLLFFGSILGILYWLDAPSKTIPRPWNPQTPNVLIELAEPRSYNVSIKFEGFKLADVFTIPLLLCILMIVHPNSKKMS